MDASSSTSVALLTVREITATVKRIQAARPLLPKALLPKVNIAIGATEPRADFTDDPHPCRCYEKLRNIRRSQQRLLTAAAVPVILTPVKRRWLVRKPEKRRNYTPEVRLPTPWASSLLFWSGGNHRSNDFTLPDGITFKGCYYTWF